MTAWTASIGHGRPVTAVKHASVSSPSSPTAVADASPLESAYSTQVFLAGTYYRGWSIPLDTQYTVERVTHIGINSSNVVRGYLAGVEVVKAGSWSATNPDGWDGYLTSPINTWTFDDPILVDEIRVLDEWTQGLAGRFAWTCREIVLNGTAFVEPPPIPKVSITINEVEFTGALEKEVRIEHNGVGEVHFAIPRGHEQATEELLARGNLIQVTIPEIHSGVIFEAFLETGDFALLSSDEQGGEILRFGGPGTLTYLARAVVAPEEYEGGTGTWKPAKGAAVFDADVTEGHILNKLIREAQSASRPSDPIPDLVDNFTSVNDSNGNPWDDETLLGRQKIPFGANYLDEFLRMARGGLLHLEMRPGLELYCSRNQGVNRTSGTFASDKVRFVKGVNIAGGLDRGMAGRDFLSHGWVRYDGGYDDVEKNGTFPYVQEGWFEYDRTDSAATARRLAKGDMGWRDTAQEALLLEVTTPWPGDPTDELTGLYLPGPSWSDRGQYWIGDLVTVDSGDEDFDYDNATHRIYAITLREDETGYLAPPIVELNAPYRSADASSSGLSTSPIAGVAQGTGGAGGTLKVDISAYQQLAEKGQPDGYASLGEDGFVPSGQLAETPLNHGSLGASATIDAAARTWHRGTLNTTCALSVSGFVADAGQIVLFGVTQDGAGGHAITWDGDVLFADGADDQPAQDPDATTWYVLWSDEGDSVVQAQRLGAAAAAAAITVQDEGTPLATAAEVLNFVGAGVTATGSGTDKTITIPGATPVTAADLVALGAVGPILIADEHSTPIVFGDLLLTEDGDDFLYADLGG